MGSDHADPCDPPRADAPALSVPWPFANVRARAPSDRFAKVALNYLRPLFKSDNGGARDADGYDHGERSKPEQKGSRPGSAERGQAALRRGQAARKGGRQPQRTAQRRVKERQRGGQAAPKCGRQRGNGARSVEMGQAAQHTPPATTHAPTTHLRLFHAPLPSHLHLSALPTGCSRLRRRWPSGTARCCATLRTAPGVAARTRRRSRTRSSPC